MTSPTPSPRWPALRGLRIFFARDIGLVLAALFAPFTAALCYLRRAGLKGTGTSPDPESLPERLAVHCRADFASPIAGLALMSSVGWFAVLVTALGAVCGVR